MSIFLAIALQAAPVDSQLKPPSPLNSPATWITPDDYPTAALRAEEEGSSKAVLTIGVDGRVTDCTATGPHELLNVATCQLLTERARFTPAKTKKGKPVQGTWSRTVVWRIPEDDGDSDSSDFLTRFGGVEGERTLTVKFTIEKDGRISDCSAFETLSPDAREEKADICTKIYAEKTSPFRDAKGNPVRKRVESVSSLKVNTIPE